MDNRAAPALLGGMAQSEEKLVTPGSLIVDIILVVLIIFMVTAPMIMKPSINVNLPKAATGDKTIYVFEENSMSIESRDSFRPGRKLWVHPGNKAGTFNLANEDTDHPGAAHPAPSHLGQRACLCTASLRATIDAAPIAPRSSSPNR